MLAAPTVPSRTGRATTFIGSGSVLTRVQQAAECGRAQRRFAPQAANCDAVRNLCALPGGQRDGVMCQRYPLGWWEKPKAKWHVLGLSKTAQAGLSATTLEGVAQCHAKTT